MKTKISIFDLEREYLDIMRELEENEGELTEELEERLAVNINDFKDKAESYRIIINKFNSDIELAKTTIRNYNNLVTNREKIIQKLEENLKGVISHVGEKRVSTATGNTSYKFQGEGFSITSSPSDSIIIEDENKIDDKFKKFVLSGDITKEEFIILEKEVERLNLLPKIKVTKVPMKTEIAKEIKSGVELEGVRKVTNYNLKIK